MSMLDTLRTLREDKRKWLEWKAQLDAMPPSSERGRVYAKTLECDHQIRTEVVERLDLDALILMVELVGTFKAEWLTYDSKPPKERSESLIVAMHTLDLLCSMEAHQ